MPFAILLVAIGFVLGCTDKDTHNAINVLEVKKEIPKDTLINPKKTYERCHIRIEPHQNKNTLIDIIQTCNRHGKPYISVASKINGKNYYENINMAANTPNSLGGCLKTTDLAIAIYRESIDILAGRKLLPEISIKEDNEDSAYDELAKNLVMIKKRFKDSLNTDSVLIYADGGVKISNLIPLMHKVRTSGFPKIYLAYGWPSIMRDFDRELMMGRSMKEIMDVVNARMPDLRKIYNKYLKKKSGFSGKITLKCTIEPSGKITEINIVSSTTDFPEFDDVVKNTVAKWKWKAMIGSSKTTIIPILFAE